MFKTLAASLVVTAMTAIPASADLSAKFGRATSKKMNIGSADMLPPAGYKGQWWVTPNQCEYSRAGRPGETVWYLIINTAHKGCASYIVERGFKDAY